MALLPWLGVRRKKKSIAFFVLIRLESAPFQPHVQTFQLLMCHSFLLSLSQIHICYAVLQLIWSAPCVTWKRLIEQSERENENINEEANVRIWRTDNYQWKKKLQYKISLYFFCLSTFSLISHVNINYKTVTFRDCSLKLLLCNLLGAWRTFTTNRTDNMRRNYSTIYMVPRECYCETASRLWNW